MPSNIFDPGTYEKDSPPNAGRAARKISKPDYTRSQSGLFDRLLAFFIGFVLGFVFLFVFYMIPVLAAAGGRGFRRRVHLYVGAQGMPKAPVPAAGAVL